MEKNYMETLLAQIREKHAKECIRQEVSDHIQDQKQHYIADGMTEEQAEEKAVADMGDPVETGIALDTLHKPKPAWSALAMIAVLCTAGIILQYTIYSSSLSAMGSYFFEKQCLYSVIGFLVLCIVYLVDYTQIAKYSRFLCLGILLLSFLIGNTNTMHGYPQIDLFYCQIRMDLFFTCICLCMALCSILSADAGRMTFGSLLYIPYFLFVSHSGKCICPCSSIYPSS